MFTSTMTVPAALRVSPSVPVRSAGRPGKRCRPRSASGGGARQGRSDSRGSSASCASSSSSFLEVSEAFYTGVGVLIGMALFATSRSDFVFGGGLFLLLLISLSTPEVLDMEQQYSAYKAQHLSRFNHALHMLCVWPRFFTALVMVSAESSWGSLMTALYALYFVISDRSLTGVAAAALVLVSAGAANAVVELFGEDAFVPAVAAHCLFWSVQLTSHLVLERPWRGDSDAAAACSASATAMTKSLVLIVRDNFLQFVLMSPLLVTIECAILCGFRQDFAQRTNVSASNMRTEQRLRSDSESSD